MISNRLVKVKSDSETQLSSKFSTLMDTDSNLVYMNQINKVEKELLCTFQNVLHSCLEKLLFLANVKIQVKDNSNSVRESFFFLSAALDHTGIGSVSHLCNKYDSL